MCLLILAKAFCEQHDGIHGIKMELCPYAAYCPEGPGKPPIGGHNIDVNAEGSQWTPLFGNANHWVPEVIFHAKSQIS